MQLFEQLYILGHQQMSTVKGDLYEEQWWISQSLVQQVLFPVSNLSTAENHSLH